MIKINSASTLAIAITAAMVVVGIIAVEVHFHPAYAYKLTKTSYHDGYNRGMYDAIRDSQGLNGHGYDASCPSGHTDVYCSGYDNGYNNAWNSGHHRSVQTVETASSQRSNLGQSNGDLEVHGSNNRIEIHQNQAASSSSDSGFDN